MRLTMRYLPPLLLLCLTLTVTADGPQDNDPNKVRRIPPPGVKIAAADRESLEQTLAQLGQEIEILQRDLNLTCSSLQIQIRVAYFAFHLAFLVLQLSLTLAQRGVGLFDIASGAAASPDWHSQRGYGGKGPACLPGVGSDRAIVRAYRERWIAFIARRGERAFGRAYLGFGCFQVRALIQSLLHRVVEGDWRSRSKRNVVGNVVLLVWR